MGRTNWRVTVSVTAALAFVAMSGCRVRDMSQHADSAGGDVIPASDTTHGQISATVSAVGPGIQVTPTDAHSVNRAFDLKLTADNFTKFTHAADSLAALRARDPAVRRYLDQQIVGAREDDAGRKWLEANPKVSAAIKGAGLSVKDYFRLGIVIAEASRFASDPAAAPPTPAGRENAEFVAAHAQEVSHLKQLTAGQTSVIVR